jgi:hypothetical protein
LHLLEEALPLGPDARHEVGLALALDRYRVREAGERVIAGLERHELDVDRLAEPERRLLAGVDEDVGEGV